MGFRRLLFRSTRPAWSAVRWKDRRWCRSRPPRRSPSPPSSELTRRACGRGRWSTTTPSWWSAWACRSRWCRGSTGTSRSPPPTTSPWSPPTSGRWRPRPAERVPEGQPSFRIGQGYDIHRLVMGRPLVLAGVTLPWDLGLDGHSDGDSVCHALTDALLGAAGMGDIGQQFPSSDERWKDASSLELLSQVAARLRAAGFAIGNVDVTVVLEVPRLDPYREAMLERLAEAIGISVQDVGLKAKTTDGLGPEGTGEAISAFAVALVTSPG